MRMDVADLSCGMIGGMYMFFVLKLEEVCDEVVLVEWRNVNSWMEALEGCRGLRFTGCVAIFPNQS